ncbi:MAG: radical SAM protein [Patescibacteria group bacterium]|nr:radical SAM protein [Patescibacteria group bacterium]
MKKVALVTLYAKDTRGIPPLGALYLATALKKNGFVPKIIYKESTEIEDVILEIENFNPDIVGMSVFTGFLNQNYVELSKKLKLKGYKIVWGNAHPSLLPEEVLGQKYVDFIVIGEGEETMIELMMNFDNKSCFSNILGLGFKDENGAIKINGRRPFINIDEYLIDWSLIDLEKFLVPYFSNRYKRTLAVTTSRGCAFNCQFCYNLVFNNRKWRGHDAEKFINNLKPIIEKYNINAIRFLDDNFFFDRERAMSIVRGLNLPYYADARVEYVNEKFVTDLKDTKCQEIMFGFESGNERILKEVVQKGTGTAEIVKAVTLLKDSSIMVSGSFVFGFPSETKEEYLNTMKFIVKLLEINNNLAFTCGWYLPYPGTELYEKSKKMGFTPPNKIEDWDRLDRWRNDYEMEWIDWDYKDKVKYTRKVVHLLALSYKRNIPILKTILCKRVKNAFFKFPIDIFLLHKLRGIYLFGSNKNFVHRIVKKMVIKLLNGRV